VIYPLDEVLLLCLLVQLKENQANLFDAVDADVSIWVFGLRNQKTNPELQFTWRAIML